MIYKFASMEEASKHFSRYCMTICMTYISCESAWDVRVGNTCARDKDMLVATSKVATMYSKKMYANGISGPCCTMINDLLRKGYSVSIIASSQDEVWTVSITYREKECVVYDSCLEYALEQCCIDIQQRARNCD